MRSIFVAVGANLGHRRAGPPRQVCHAALEALAGAGIGVARRSRLYRTRPVPPSGQPDYINGVVALRTRLGPDALLDALLAVEDLFDRRRGRANAPRTLDLDLLAYDNLVRAGPRLNLPHPRMADRAFVLVPLADIAGDWRHPITGKTAAEMWDGLADDGNIRPLAQYWS